MNDPRIEKLRQSHVVEDFDRGREALNRFLSRYAWQSQQSGASLSYVALAGEEVAGYYTLVVGQVEYDDAADRLKKGLSRHPVLVMLLARLAVSLKWQGQRLGAGLLKDAIQRTLQAADIAGIRAFVLHAKDDEAKAFYEHLNCLPSPTDPYHLFRLLKDIRGFLARYLRHLAS
jgi:GNAT superfamily N-acetyltransferase